MSASHSQSQWQAHCSLLPNGIVIPILMRHKQLEEYVLPARGAGDWSVIIAFPAFVPSLSGDVTSIAAGGALQVFVSATHIPSGAVPFPGAGLRCAAGCAASWQDPI